MSIQNSEQQIDLMAELAALQARQAAELQLLQDAIDAEVRAKNSTEYARRKQAEKAEQEAARVAKLDVFRNGALNDAQEQIAALRGKYETFLADLAQWEREGAALVERHKELNRVVPRVTDALEKGIMGNDWVGTFPTDSHLVQWVDEQLKIIETFTLGVPVTIQFDPAQRTEAIRVGLVTKLKNTATNMETMNQSWVLTEGQIRERWRAKNSR